MPQPPRTQFFLVVLLGLVVGQSSFVEAQLPNLRVGLPRDEDSLRYKHVASVPERPRRASLTSECRQYTGG